MSALLRPAVLLLLLATALGGLPAVAAGPAAAHPEDFADVDHDGVREPPYGPDNCPGGGIADYNPRQTDTDGDGTGDECDDDDDGDGVADGDDTCAHTATATQTDSDGDRRGDACDDDDDGDGVADARDNCRVVPNPDQRDADGADPGDACPGGAAPGAQPGDDVTPPRLAVTLRARYRAAEVRRGLPVTITCSEACSVAVTLERGGRVRASGVATLGAAGRTFGFVRPVRRGAGRLRIVAADVTGNRSVVARRVRIVR